MEYTKYNKTMVLLSEENRDFAAKSEQAIYGNLRIETGNNKGAISLSVQNLRFYERNRYIYKLILFGEKKERTIHAVMGSLILNRFGTSENYFRFDPINVDGKGGKLEDYSVAIIAAVSMKDNREPLHPVLKGKLIFAGSNVMAAGKDKTMDTTGDNNFQNSRAERNTEDRGNSQAEYRESSQAEYRDNSQAESRQFDNRKIGDRNLGNRQDERNTVPAEKRNQNNRTMKDNDIFDDALESSSYEVKDYVRKKKTTYNQYYNQYLKEVCEKTAKAAELYDAIVPFTRDKTGAQWKRIANVNNLPLVSQGAMWGASKYRHYIFGETSKMYYLGVPGRFINEEQPEGGKSGFVLWQPIVGAEGLEATKADCSLENRMTAYGYWITAIDKETGDIIDPV